MMLTQADYARRHNRSRQTVGKWIDRGLISGTALQKDGKRILINAEVADVQLQGRLDPGQKLASAKPPREKPVAPETTILAPSDAEDEEDGDPGSPYAVEKARLVRLQADAQEMKNAAARGESSTHVEIERRWSDILTRARALQLALPGRVRQACPDLTTEQFAVIDTEARFVLQELARAKFV